jgi:photosystem II stability/assembly factor-like uncharacterized protein
MKILTVLTSTVILMFLLLFFSCGGEEEGMKICWEKVDLGPGHSDDHILCIAKKGNLMMLGTHGEGLLISHDNGVSWVNKTKKDGLSWNYIHNIDFTGDRIVLATMGDGINISSDGGKKWKRYGYNFFGPVYTYCTGVYVDSKKALISSADGLMFFRDDEDWRVLEESAGISSQYIYCMHTDGERIFLGSMGGLSLSFDSGKSWKIVAPDNSYTEQGLPRTKMLCMALNGDIVYAGTPKGLFKSADAGEIWQRIGTDMLPSDYIISVAVTSKGELWAGTYKGLAHSPDGAETWRLFGPESGLPSRGINCIHVDNDGAVYVGTNSGLYKSTTEKPEIPKPEESNIPVFDKVEEPEHRWMIRPVSPEYNNQLDQCYLYGTTMGGEFRQHQGVEYNNPEGTPLRAVADGQIVYVKPEIGHLVLKNDQRYDRHFVYNHYHHMHQISKKVGDRVKQGDIIGSIGKKGNVTNEHLHFEVSLSEKDDDNRESWTRNSELWVKPLPGCGTIVGRVVDSEGRDIPNAKIYGVEKPGPVETPYSYTVTYQDKVTPDPYYQENFVIGDVPAGEYLLWTEVSGKKYSLKAKVEAGKVTPVVFEVK